MSDSCTPVDCLALGRGIGCPRTSRTNEQQVSPNNDPATQGGQYGKINENIKEKATTLSLKMNTLPIRGVGFQTGWPDSRGLSAAGEVRMQSNMRPRSQPSSLSGLLFRRPTRLRTRSHYAAGTRYIVLYHSQNNPEESDFLRTTLVSESWWLKILQIQTIVNSACPVSLHTRSYSSSPSVSTLSGMRLKSTGV